MSLDDSINDGPMSGSIRVVDGRTDVDMYLGPLEQPGKGDELRRVAAEVARLEKLGVDLTSNAEYIDELLS